MRALILAGCLVVLAGCDASRGGLDAYRDGRFVDAHAAFSSAVKDAGSDASPELLYDAALAALRAADLNAAHAAAKAAAARGGPAIGALSDFLLANVAFARCELAQAQANSVESEPFAFDYAIAQAESARRQWTLAERARGDWPEAARNVERAAKKIDELKKQRAGADGKRRPGGPQNPTPKLVPKSDGKKPESADVPAPNAKDDGSGKDGPAAVDESTLSADEVRRLFDKLAAKEKEKLALRGRTRQAKSADVEKDW